MKCRIGILFFVFCLLSCSREKKNIQEIGVNQNLYLIDIDKAEKNEKILLSEICSQMKTIILETKEDVLIGEVGGVQVYKDYVFVLDKNRNVGLYAFKRDGTFIRKYGNRGIGPGDYLSIKDFTIDPENEIIYLMDDDATQILLYDINTGEYVNKIKLENNPFNCFHIQYNNEKLYTDIDYWDINQNGCLLQEVNQMAGNQTQCWLDIKKYNMGWNGGLGHLERMEESFFYARHQETCKYVNYFMDTIISIGKNQIEPYAVIKEKDWISSKVLSQIMEDSKNDVGRFHQAILDKGFSHNIHSVIDWNDYIIFCYMKHHNKYFVLYNKRNGKTRITQLLINDIGYDKPKLVNRFACSDENGLYEIIGMFSIEQYLERVKEDDFLKKSVDKYEQLRNLPEDTNPIIFYYEFKKE